LCLIYQSALLYPIVESRPSTVTDGLNECDTSVTLRSWDTQCLCVERLPPSSHPPLLYYRAACLQNSLNLFACEERGEGRWSCRQPTHAHTHTHTHRHRPDTFTHTYSRAPMHTSMHACTYTHTQVQTRTRPGRDARFPDVQNLPNECMPHHKGNVHYFHM
jgi:hypothetical protein